MPQTLRLRSRDPKKKYARLPRALRPNKSRYKARSHLMNTTNPNAIGGEQNATPMRECIGRLTCFVEGDRDDGEARIAKRDVKVLGKAKKRAKAAGDSGELGPFDRTNTVKLWKRTSIGSAGT